MASLSTERQKILTRARNILLNAGIYTGAQAIEIGPGLLNITNVGPAMADLILHVAHWQSGNAVEHDYLFPYPEGLESRPYTTATDSANVTPDDFEMNTYNEEGEPPTTPATALIRLLHGLREYGESWADGYLSALIDGADNLPGAAEVGVQVFDGALNPPPAATTGWDLFRVRLDPEVQHHAEQEAAELARKAYATFQRATTDTNGLAESSREGC